MTTEGSVLILTLFVVLVVSTLCLSYFKIIELETIMQVERQKFIQATTMARSGIEDALSEIGQGHAWQLGQMSSQWQHATGSPDNTFYKSTDSPVPLTQFTYQASFTVTVSGDATVDTVNIESIGLVENPNKPIQPYVKMITANAVRSLSGDIYLVNISE